MSDDSKWEMSVPSRQTPSGTCLKPNKVDLLPFSFYKFHTYCIQDIAYNGEPYDSSGTVIRRDFWGNWPCVRSFWGKFQEMDVYAAQDPVEKPRQFYN